LHDETLPGDRRLLIPVDAGVPGAADFPLVLVGVLDVLQLNPGAVLAQV
jgi:hypothetical protein